MELKYLPTSRKIFVIFVIFQISGLLIFSDFIFFILISFLYIGYIFYLKSKEKYFFSAIYVVVVFISLLLNFGVNPNVFYRSGVGVYSGNYLISNSVGMKRGEFPFYSGNNYILYDLNRKNKIVVYCSLYFNKCNKNNNLNDRVFIKYVVGKNGVNYLYYLGDGNDVSDVFFIEKYNYEVFCIIYFYIFYIFFNMCFLFLFCFKAKK